MGTVEAGQEYIRALDDARHWLWSWDLQWGRFGDSLRVEGQGATAEARRRSHSRVTYEKSVLVFTAMHCFRVIDRLSGYSRFSALFQERLDGFEDLRMLRNLLEHWDEQQDDFREGNPKKRSGKEFETKHPTKNPWSFAYADGDVRLAGIEALSVKELSTFFADVEAWVIAEEEKR